MPITADIYQKMAKLNCFIAIHIMQVHVHYCFLIAKMYKYKYKIHII